MGSDFNVNCFALNQEGEGAGVTIWVAPRFAVKVDGASRLDQTANPYERS